VWAVAKGYKHLAEKVSIYHRYEYGTWLSASIIECEQKITISSSYFKPMPDLTSRVAVDIPDSNEAQSCLATTRF
jgi:hypothetical protein